MVRLLAEPTTKAEVTLAKQLGWELDPTVGVLTLLINDYELDHYLTGLFRPPFRFTYIVSLFKETV